MNKRKISIVVGAGAGVPFGMPLGRELRDQIIDNTNDDLFRETCLFYAKKNDKHTFNGEYGDIAREFFANKFLRANTYSIDSFLSNQGWDIPDIGKIAIATVLLKEEKKYFSNTRKSYALLKKHYYGVDTIDERKFSYEKEILYKDNWIQILIDLLNPQNGKVEHFLERLRQIEFISFNYDRFLEQNMIEHYYNNYMGVNVYGNSEQLLKEKILAYKNDLHLEYVYGALGPTWPEQVSDFFPDANQCIFSSELSPEIVLNASKNIDTIRKCDGSVTYFLDSEKIFFLGFSFNEDNISKIRLYNIPRDRGIKLFVTSVGLPDYIQSSLKDYFGKHNVNFFNSESPSSEALEFLTFV